ncbi:MAG TPA: fatty acid desaturase [Planctomycetota bacterium]|nr:fatty acid desaturase [Planctomycetota bacterium]
MDSHAEGPRPLDWTNILFLTLTPVLGVPVLIWHTLHVGFEPWMAVLFLGMYALVGLSVCAGYHRYFSHKSYECSRGVQLFYALFGAMAAQNSILRWSAGHRKHHSCSDSDWDPYSIQRGFWWAHVLWVFRKNPDYQRGSVKDLESNPVVMWQHRWYRTVLIVGGFGLPLAIGAVMGDWMAGLLWGGFLRIVVVHHSTFLVNSLAHYFGRRTYDGDASARDNWAVALLTFGEGYHSFHHKFPSDFRNGVRWYAWDPAKWFIAVLKLCGMAWNLREMAAPVIESARVKAAARVLEERVAATPASQRYLSELRARLQDVRKKFEDAFELWRQQASERRLGQSYRATYDRYRAQLRQAREEWRRTLQWIKSLRMFETA